ncbi:MAG TPA: acetoacetate--CoA ligase [Chloroflexota bacterium]|nr:acetoacetate--CoA ligase [Chloroflexota bacterium]
MARVQEGTLLWSPSEEQRRASNLADYIGWLATHHGLHFKTYDELWQWSCSELERFWVSLYEYFDIQLHQHFGSVLRNRKMPGAVWFDGAELNYAEHVFRNETPDRPALIFKSETRPMTEISWATLHDQTAHMAAALKRFGIKPGDRVAAYMPNIPETVAAFLATASLGGVFSSCSPDFGMNAVVDRFAQIEPRVLFAVDGYTYGGKSFDRREVLRELLQQLPTVEHVVFVPYLDEEAAFDDPRTVPLAELLAAPAPELAFQPVPFEHPLWVLYSSGTTGLPKGLVHSQGGVLLEHLKNLAIHCDVKPGDRLFWHTSTGWMMWNLIVSGLACAATVVLYDGNPGYPSLEAIWQYAQDAQMTCLGTSAAFITSCAKAGLAPKDRFDLSSLKMIGSTGSPLPVEGFEWVYDSVKPDVWLGSISGGTDVVSAFVVGNVMLPVYAGELQCRALGCKVQAFDERGRPVLDQQGELVITEPMPSMPIYFWNDPGGKRYHDSYFDVYPGVWRHGDWIRINRRGGSVIEGRSDSTLNRQGVRMGSSEIYAAVESLPEIADSLVIGVEQPDGSYYMPLFVVLSDSRQMDAALEAKVKDTLRSTLSPRHVPDEVVAVPAIPRTLSGKKMEVPVKKLFQGVPLAKAANPGATADPQALHHFEELAKARGR